MMDLSDLLSYRENNRLEAKSAARGLPRSLWQTYSAFANSSGGVILLGAEELPDKTLIPAGVKNVDKLLDDFWNTVNNPQKTSENILLDEDVRVFQQDGADLIAIFVPQANRRVKPIYLNDNPKRSFRRNHTGDYLCKMGEIRSMMRDAADESQDAMVLESAPMDYLDADTVKRYRSRFGLIHEGHVWNDYDDADFLASIGAAGIDGGGVPHPTVAGLV
ncbi:MAG: ATP-binding protein, partial [Eggerthellaceae bacterium]|nr:ATP-binding protein [Eggerthellaceae bacterium]